jgi:hypothetical protein
VSRGDGKKILAGVERGDSVSAAIVSIPRRYERKVLLSLEPESPERTNANASQRLAEVVSDASFERGAAPELDHEFSPDLTGRDGE